MRREDRTCSSVGGSTDSNLITEGATFSESVAVQTTVRTPRRTDRRTKTCLLVLPGRVAKDARNNNVVANRIARWTAGERMSLWLEGMMMTKADQPPRKTRKRPLTGTDDEAEKNGAMSGNEAKSSRWRAGVRLAKQCNMRAVWDSLLTQLQRKRR